MSKEILANGKRPQGDVPYWISDRIEQDNDTQARNVAFVHFIVEKFLVENNKGTYRSKETVLDILQNALFAYIREQTGDNGAFAGLDDSAIRWQTDQLWKLCEALAAKVADTLDDVMTSEQLREILLKIVEEIGRDSDGFHRDLIENWKKSAV